MPHDLSTENALGRRLRAWITGRQPRLSDEGVADKLGVSLSTLRAWIRGARTPKASQIVALGALCGVSEVEQGQAVLELARLAKVVAVAA